MIFLLLILSFFLIGCETSKPEPSHFRGVAMTIPYHVIIGDPVTSHIDKTIRETFDHIDGTFNRYNPNSEISQFNRLPAHKPFHLSSELEELLAFTGVMVKLSGGRFDPTTLPLQKLWEERLAQGRIPENDELSALSPAIGWGNLSTEGSFLVKKESETALDLGGIAKGYCVDLLLDQLLQQGYQNIYVEWGGEIRAQGHHPSGRDWMVYIANLKDTDPRNAISHLSISGRAIATSGNYLQNWHIDGKTYTHIFNPKTLSPLEVESESIASATVIAPTCALADAIATSLMLFSTVEEADSWAESLRREYPKLEFWIIAQEALQEPSRER